MQTGTHRPRQHGNIKCLRYLVFRKESKLQMVCTPITLKKYHTKSNSVCDLSTHVSCCVTRCCTVNLPVAVYHIGRLGSRNGHPLNASPCSLASCSRLAGHFSQPSLYLLTPVFSLLLQPSLHTVTQEKQQHTMSFFLKKDVKSLQSTTVLGYNNRRTHTNTLTHQLHKHMMFCYKYSDHSNP